MVDHVRKAIRTAAKTALTGLTTTGVNVFTSRVSKLTEGEMPGWYVMLRDERGDDDGRLSAFERSGQLVIEGWAAGGDGLEDKLDTMAAEAETAIYTNAALMALLVNFGAPMTQIEMPQPDDEGALRIGKIRILFPVTYRTAITDPTTIV
jgi:hypothetical protein